MRSEWRRVRLGDLIKIEHGWAFKGDYFSDDLSGNPIVVNIGNFQYEGGFRFNSTKCANTLASILRSMNSLPEIYF